MRKYLKYEKIADWPITNSVEPQMLRLFDKASSLVLANITMDIFDDLDDVEVCASDQIEYLKAQAWLSKSKFGTVKDYG
ncbi:hypothetical protein RIF29_34603 [Crotalaria pallida]|uniref:Uncharacterized protein n=1 Tax=Crotalaria pallida TaxID=3830 RepID=A0AAN9HRB2_CROPI